MDIRWFICMKWIFLYQHVNAMENISTTSIPLPASKSGIVQVSISRRTRTTLIVSSFHAPQSQNMKTSSEINTPSLSHFSPQPKTESSTLTTKSISKLFPTIPSHVNKVTPTTLSSSAHVPGESSTLTTTKSTPKLFPIISSHVDKVTPTTLSSSVYVPAGKATNDGIPLLILIPAAAGGGVFLILIIILCCCIHRRIKRKRNERIFQKYYRPTFPSNSSNHSDLESDDESSNMWASQTKIALEKKEEQSVDSKSFQGISNKAFSKSESLPEMSIIQEKSPSDTPGDIPNEAEQSISNNVKVFSAQEVNSSSKDDPGPAETELEKPLAIGDVLPVEEKSQFDSARASLLILQNLDDVLNNECLDNDDTPKEEISDISTDDQKKKDKVGHFVVMHPFVASNTDEISLDVGTTVLVLASKPSGWSWVANQNGDTGWFPTQYLDKSSDDDHEFGYSIPDLKRLQFAVLQSFNGTGRDELSLKQYDIVSVIENNPSGWSYVNEPSVGTGWYPTSYLEPLVYPKNDKRRSSSECSDYLDVIDEDITYIYASSEEIQKVRKEGHYQEYEAKAYRASHAYTGGNEDELTFKENETILVLQETNSGWWRGSTYLGEGWFPATFVEDATNEETSDDESYEYISDTKRKEEACPYEVTQIVTEKNRPNKESDREIVHEVPQPISNKAAEKHKSRGKASIKPRRPPPPPPPSEQHPPASQPTLVQPTAAPTHSTAPLPSTGSTASPPQSIAAIPTPQTHHSLNPPTQGSQTTPPLSTIPPPTPLRSPISPVPEETPLVFQAPQIDVKKNEDSDEPGNVEGVVIVPPRDESADTLSKLIKVTKRRSVIDPNPHQPPPNRPVPVPPPRRARNAPISTGNHSRSRPIKTPRNLGNKKPDMPSIKDVPKVEPERPPPPLPEKLAEFRQKRLSSSDESSSGQQLNEEQSPKKQSASNNVKETGKASSKPQPRRRISQKRADGKGDERDDKSVTPNSISKSSSLDHERDSAPPTPPRSHSLSDEPPDDHDVPKSRPVIKPRSISVDNLFASALNDRNSDREATSPNHTGNSDQIKCDNNQNIRPSRPSPPKPRPKTRRKSDQSEIQV